MHNRSKMDWGVQAGSKSWLKAMRAVHKPIYTKLCFYKVMSQWNIFSVKVYLVLPILDFKRGTKPLFYCPTARIQSFFWIMLSYWFVFFLKSVLKRRTLRFWQITSEKQLPFFFPLHIIKYAKKTDHRSSEFFSVITPFSVWSWNHKNFRDCLKEKQDQVNRNEVFLLTFCIYLFIPLKWHFTGY